MKPRNEKAPASGELAGASKTSIFSTTLKQDHTKHKSDVKAHVIDLSATRARRDHDRARAWRWRSKLPSVRDLADEYRRTHFLREPVLIAALPEDVIREVRQ